MKKGIFFLLAIIVVLLILLFNKNIVNSDNESKFRNQLNFMINLFGYNIEEVKEFASSHNLNLEINEVFADNYQINTVIDQNIKVGHKYKVNDLLIITVVIGNLNDEKEIQNEKYVSNHINELGRVPIMMYHGIHDKKNIDTDFIGGNVDKDGYQRTSEAFRNDLEFYYNNNYRMIRLTDYVDGIINVEFGKSPIVLTFDDGLKNNINVLGLDENGEIIIDPNCAVGILEEFKKKYPDYNVTATFFVNSSMFNQSEYNDKILKWLVNNGYDIGNHSATHADFTKIDVNSTNYQIGSIYEKLDEIIPNQYVNIVALPFGSPYKKSHENFAHILNSTYNGKNYTTKSTLRVGWESDYSPFSVDFDKTFIKRIRAYDNNGNEFDISASFKNLENTRYISDGNKNTVVIKESDLNKIKNSYNLEVITYP